MNSFTSWLRSKCKKIVDDVSPQKQHLFEHSDFALIHPQILIDDERHESDDHKENPEVLDQYADSQCGLIVEGKYLYQNLYSSSKRIRLLELLPESVDFGASSKPWYEHVNIRCNLIVVEIDEAPPYDALSYTWGKDKPSIEINVNGSKVLVRRNLADALAALRGKSSRLLWNDALCIDQGSDPERSHQVQLMGDIYRHASTVFVWLGRSEARSEDLCNQAIPILERFGEAQPTTKLPPAPPDANLPREADFDQWIQNLKASYNLKNDKDRQRWQDDWQSQYDHWNQMKKERMWTQMRRERRPNLIAQLESSKVSWSSLQEELRKSRERQIAQNRALAELQAQVHHHKPALDAPLSRLMKQFLARQEQTLSATEFLVRSSGTLSSLPVGPAEVQKLYHRIDGNLGEFQRYLYDIQQLLKEKQKQGFNMKTELDCLEKWKTIEVAERRAFINLQIQHQGWCSLETTQAESLRRMKLRQDSTLKEFIISWNHGRKEILRRGQDLSHYETQQREKFKDHITEQASALKSLTEEHHHQWVRSPVMDPKIDEFLNLEELQAIAALKDSARCLHKHLLTICMSEILARESDLLSRQQAQLWYDVDIVTQSVLSVEKEEEQMQLSLIQAQGDWVHRWEMKRKREADQWRRQVLQQGADKSSLTETFLALEEFCNLRYWNRLWIVQEILLAKELVLCFGDDARTTRDWSLLSEARLCLDSIPALWNLAPSIKTQLETVQESFPFLLDRLREGRDEGWSLRRLVEITEGTRCAHPRDKVYGLLGLANDFHKGDIVPDIKKSTQEVFMDTIRWYYQKYGSDDSCPSIIRLSKSMQLSFRTHDELPQQLPQVDLNLTKLPPQKTDATQYLPFNEAFCVKATQRGPIMDLKQLLDDSALLALRQRDWIGLMAEFLDSDGTQTSRAEIEKELVRLSSIKAGLAIQHQTTAYGTSEAAGSSGTSTPSTEGLGTAALRLHRSNDEQQFFMLDNGQFGIASNCIRENDVLCEFEDKQTALILRRTTDHRFALVSRAIISQLPRMSQVSHRAVQLGPEDDVTAMLKYSTQLSATNNRAENSTLYVHLDATSLQQLTKPYEVFEKHKFREASFVHEANFGWHEFMTFGVDVEAESLDASIFTDETATETESSPENTSDSQIRQPVSVVIEEVPAHTPETTTTIDSKDLSPLELLKLALSPQPLVSQFLQSGSHTLFLDFGS